MNIFNNRFKSWDDGSAGDIALDQSVYGEYPEMVTQMQEEGTLCDVLRLLAFDEDILDIYWTDNIYVNGSRAKLEAELFYFKAKNKKKGR